ncbi:uncharacterized protein ACRADG_011241 [Cochliomyia hominivorax]
MLQTYFEFISLILLLGFSNGAQAKECYSCEGINCLRTSKVTNKTTCVDPVDNCVTVFDESTVIARGCYSSLPEVYRQKCDNLSDSNCHKCYKNLCNDRGAISCLQCNSENNNDCSNAISKIESSRCPVSTSPNSYCYTRKSTNYIERGCLIDTSEQLKCFEDNSCEMCIPSSEACNRDTLIVDSESGSKRITIYSALILVHFILTLL